MVYADYQFYTDEYHGTMPEANFSRLAIRASAYLDYITSDRAKSYNDRDNKLKMACCAVADDYLSLEQGGGIASESNGRLSVSYVNGSTAMTPQKRLYETVRLFLLNTGLLSRVVKYCDRY